MEFLIDVVGMGARLNLTLRYALVKAGLDMGFWKGLCGEMAEIPGRGLNGVGKGRKGL